MNGLSTFLFFHRCYCNVLGSQNAHPLTETYISRTLFVLHVIYNKPYYKCVVRFKLNRGPSACRTVCGEPFGSVFFHEPCHPYRPNYKLSSDVCEKGIFTRRARASAPPRTQSTQGALLISSRTSAIQALILNV